MLYNDAHKQPQAGFGGPDHLPWPFNAPLQSRLAASAPANTLMCCTCLSQHAPGHCRLVYYVCEPYVLLQMTRDVPIGMLIVCILNKLASFDKVSLRVRYPALVLDWGALCPTNSAIISGISHTHLWSTCLTVCCHHIHVSIHDLQLSVASASWMAWSCYLSV